MMEFILAYLLVGTLTAALAQLILRKHSPGHVMAGEVMAVAIVAWPWFWALTVYHSAKAAREARRR